MHIRVTSEPFPQAGNANQCGKNLIRGNLNIFLLQYLCTLSRDNTLYATSVLCLPTRRSAKPAHEARVLSGVNSMFRFLKLRCLERPFLQPMLQ